MPKHKSGYPAVDAAIERAKGETITPTLEQWQGDTQKKAEAYREEAQNVIEAVKNGEMTTDAAQAILEPDLPAKKARKKPDRTNPPYYEIYMAKPDGSQHQLCAMRETSAKALKYIFANSVQAAKDNWVYKVVRCKRITMAELMAE